LEQLKVVIRSLPPDNIITLVHAVNITDSTVVSIHRHHVPPRIDRPCLALLQ